MSLKRTVYSSPNDTISGSPLTNRAIVLDLDYTLVATQDEDEKLENINLLHDPQYLKLRPRFYYAALDNIFGKGTPQRYRYWGITRPYVKEFLIFCFSYFKYVIVWSAGQYKYVHEIVNFLFRDLPRPHFIFTFDDVEKPDKADIYKPLKKILDTHLQNTGIGIHNIIMIDDTPAVLRANKANGVIIPPFRPAMNKKELLAEDRRLLDLINWFQRPEVMDCRDLTKIRKDRIFT